MYNWALRKKTDAFYKDHQRLSYKDLSAMLPDVKQQEASSWLSEVASVPLQQSLRHLDRVFLTFFEGRAKYPTFKKKRARQSATYVGAAFTGRNGCIALAKMSDPLDIRWSRSLPDGAIPSSVTITKDSADRYAREHPGGR